MDAPRAVAIMVVVAATSCANGARDDEASSSEGAIASDPNLNRFSGVYRSKNAFDDNCGGAAVGGGTPYKFVGYEPRDPGPHPVFVYTVGSEIAAAGTGYDSPEALLVIAEMASRGFVAVSVAYENNTVPLTCAQLDMKASCIYRDVPGSALRAICERSSADCKTKDLVVGGMSQGAMVALRSQNFYRPNGVAAAWALSVIDGVIMQSCMNASGGTRVLPNEKVWVTNGVADPAPGADLAVLQRITGWPVGPMTARAADGTRGGYFQVQESDLQPGNKGGANHTFYRFTDDSIKTTDWDDNWAPPASNPWSLATRLDWLAAHVRP